MEPTKSGTAIKAILDLEDENRFLVDENDQLKFENNQLQHHKKMLTEAIQAHVGKLKKDVQELEWRSQDLNGLFFLVTWIVGLFYVWVVLNG